MSTSIEIKINNVPLADILGVIPGGSVQVECRGGIPTKREWRNRIKDAEFDGCVTVVKKQTKGAK